MKKKERRTAGTVLEPAKIKNGARALDGSSYISRAIVLKTLGFESYAEYLRGERGYTASPIDAVALVKKAGQAGHA